MINKIQKQIKCGSRLVISTFQHQVKHAKSTCPDKDLALVVKFTAVNIPKSEDRMIG
jgi:hypothetical protein